eukprot:24490_1
MDAYLIHRKHDIVCFRECLSTTLDDFHHLLCHHHDDRSFEIIFNSLQDCNIDQCQIFDQNYRDRNGDVYQTNIDSEDCATTQLFDKMHCHYLHCFDIGHRFYSKYNYYHQ